MTAINLPRIGGTYKVVQFYVNGRPYLRMAYTSAEYLDEGQDRRDTGHQNIVRRFAREKDLTTRFEETPYGKIIVPTNDQVRIVGAGHVRLNTPRTVFTFRDVTKNRSED